MNLEWFLSEGAEEVVEWTIVDEPYWVSVRSPEGNVREPGGTQSSDLVR